MILLIEQEKVVKTGE